MNDKITIAFQGLPLVFPKRPSLKAMRLLEDGKALSFLEEVLGYDQYLAVENMDPSHEDLIPLFTAYAEELKGTQWFKKNSDD